MRANHPPKAASQYGNEVAMSIRSEDVAFHGHDSLFSNYFFALLVQPPISPTTGGPTNTAVHAMVTTAVKRPVRNDLHCGWKNTSLVEDCAAVWVWGSPWDLERAPRKFGVVGREASRGKWESDSRCWLVASRNSRIRIPISFSLSPRSLRG